MKTETPPFMVRCGKEALKRLQESFDTGVLLAVASQADQFCVQWSDELRSGLLVLHGMAHTVINGAPLTQLRGDETMTEMAASLSLALGEAAETLRHGARVLQEIADLAPE